MKFDFSSSTNNKINTLHQYYLSLPEAEQQLLLVLAVVYKPISAIKLKRLLQRLESQGLIANSGFADGVST